MMIHLIEELHKGGKGMVLINGWLSKPFPVDCGVRQVDPSAPILYVYSAQPLISLSTRGVLRPHWRTGSHPDPSTGTTHPMDDITPSGSGTGTGQRTSKGEHRQHQRRC
jgi:hypothetical protein